MMDQELLRKAEAAFERHASKTTEERFEAMIQRGAIDADGNVLVRGPGSSGTPWTARKIKPGARLVKRPRRIAILLAKARQRRKTGK